jgi:hypothetical protein
MSVLLVLVPATPLWAFIFLSDVHPPRDSLSSSFEVVRIVLTSSPSLPEMLCCCGLSQD